MIQYVRILLFIFLPLVVASLHIVFMNREDRTRARIVELFLVYVLVVSIGLNGIFSFTGHFFFSDRVAGLIGWPVGNPFQLEVAFANLALGVLGLLSFRFGAEFRMATAIAAAIFLFGANVVHIKDIVDTGNYAPGNGGIQILSNFLRPILLIGLLVAYTRGVGSGDDDPAATQAVLVQQSAGSDGPSRWRQILGSGVMLGSCFAIAGGIAGFMSGDLVLWLSLSTALGLLLGSGLQFVFSSTRSLGHPEQKA